MPTYVVVRVDGDARDTHATEETGGLVAALIAALDVANPDDGARLEYARVNADDAGAARLMAPARWYAPQTSARFRAAIKAYRDGAT